MAVCSAADHSRRDDGGSARMLGCSTNRIEMGVTSRGVVEAGAYRLLPGRMQLLPRVFLALATWQERLRA